MNYLTTFIALVIILVIVGAGVFVFRSNQDSSLPLDESAMDDLNADLDGPTVNGGQFLQEVPSTTPASSPTNSVDPSATPVTEESIITISIDDSGFTPSKVTVAAGTKVNFINNGQALHWPASDLHPTHQALAGFDAKRGLATGETYSFTFTKTGNWGMHDHLNPSATGVITVQ